MKIGHRLVCILGLLSFGVGGASAQQSATIAREGSGQIVAFSSAEGFGGKSIVGRPYSGDSETELFQTLADGTHIDQKLGMTKTYRDSQGRVRIERYFPENMQTGVAGNLIQVMIHDPITGAEYVLNPRDRTARQLNPSLGFHVASVAGGEIVVPALQPKIASAEDTPVSVAAPQARAPLTRTEEDLGTQTIEGLVVEGKRITHIIPVGVEGNDRPMQMVTEVWFSKELEITVLSKTSNPRSGETTRRVTHIVQAEPDPALFQVPPDYTITQQ